MTKVRRNKAVPAKTKTSVNRIRLERTGTIATGIGAALILAATETPSLVASNDSVSLGVQAGSATIAEDTSFVPADQATQQALLNPIPQLPNLGDEEWNSEMQTSFHALAVKEALGNISPEEKSRLDELAATRRNLKNPRTGDEVLWEYQQRRLTNDLLNSLKRYVEFHEGPRATWKTPDENSNG